MAAILDVQNGRRYGQVQFVNEVVDYIATAAGRRPCYDLLEGLQARQNADSTQLGQRFQCKPITEGKIAPPLSFSPAAGGVVPARRTDSR